MNVLSSGYQSPTSAAGKATASANANVTRRTSGSHATAMVGATPYTAIINASSVREAAKAMLSVTVDARGMSARWKAMFAMIEPRSCTEGKALMVVAITSWKGTIAQAMLR